MQISIVIPHYGDPAPAVSLIQQLSSQGGRIIVVDDFSPIPFPEIAGTVVARRGVNGGFGSAVNTGAALAEGEWLLVLNSDLTVSPDFIEAMTQAAERHGPSVLSPRVLDSNHEHVWVGRDFPVVRHQVVEWLTPLARWRNTSAWHRAVGHDVRTSSQHDVGVDWVIGAAMLIPLDAFRAIGGFDERFFMNCEEVDLQRRLRQLRVRSVALAHPIVTHAGGGSSPSNKRRRWLVESRLQYAEKWGSRGTLHAALVASTALNFLVNSVRRAVGRPVRPLETARIELGLLSGQKGSIS